MILDEALSAFFTESRDLLERMEQALLRIEQAPDDAETINAIFRAAHTIKGSAGIFGLHDVVAFTHVAENVLDRVRAGELRFDGGLADLFLHVGDHIRALVDAVARGTALDSAASERGTRLVRQMEEALGQSGHTQAGTPPAEPDETAGMLAGPDGVSSGDWHVSLRFGPETIRSGFDPLSFVRYLTTLGEIVGLVMPIAPVPALAALEPDECHLGFEIRLRAATDQATLEEVFDFVREDSFVRVLPPHASLQAYADLLRERSLTGEALGDWLVRCGSLTESERAAALATPVDTLRADDRVARAAAPLSPESAPSEPQAGDRPREARPAEATYLRVDAARLDQLIDLVGELIVAGAGAHLVAKQHRLKDLVEATSAVARLMEEVRDTALTLRMVQIGGTFNRFQRVVRDVSQELGKDIELRISGAETELDKAVVEKLADPLTHLVRNSMDHGIESAERRLAAGKPAQGTVSLHARHEAGQVVIEVSDDGGGLARDRILRKGIERGLMPADANPSDKEVFDLIFQPGFSTAEQVSNLSGRGVGMDVVKRNITALRGTIDLESRPGAGTTIRIRLPLTLAIIEGFLMSVGRSSFVVPLGVVVECVELGRHEAAGRDWLDLRGEVLPLVRLRELYDVEGESGRRQNIVVVSSGGRRVGLVVDQLLGELQTVIKPLGRVFQAVRGVAGFTLLSNGTVALLLDVPNLVDEVARRNVAGAAAAPGTRPRLEAGLA